MADGANAAAAAAAAAPTAPAPAPAEAAAPEAPATPSKSGSSLGVKLMSPDRLKRLEMERIERERLKKLRAAQKAALESVRNEQNSQIAESAGKSASDRLSFLMNQSDIFAHFMGGRAPPSPSKADSAKGAAAGSSRRSQKARMTEEEEDQALLQDELDEDTAPTTTRLTVQPACIKGGTMRSYQLQGLNWLIKLYEHGINGILADEMGLGKTLQTISVLGYLKTMRGVSGPHLIIVPNSTLGNWIKEIARWCPVLSSVRFHGNAEERVAIRANDLIAGKFDVCVTTYEMALIEKNTLKRFHWRYLIIDEAHRIKNENSKLSEVVRMFQSQYRLLITGTPLQNNLHELWALLNFLLPDVFASSDDFDSWFDMSGDGDKSTVIKQLHKVLQPFLLRRLKSDVAKELPPKTEVKLFVGISKMQREWYRNLLSKDIAAINAATKQDRVRLLNVVMQLRKCCNHPYLFDGAEPGPPYEEGMHLIENSGKMVLLDRLLPRLQANGDRVLIFSQMTRCLDILEDYMRWRGYFYCRLDGGTARADREAAIDDFNAPDSKAFCFLLSTRAGGLGINLATANIVILFDSDWNPQVDLQAQDRAHRIGQTKQVKVFRLVTEGTIEEKVVERAEMKLQLDALVIQQGRLVEQTKALDKDQLAGMLRFGADEMFRSKESTITDDDIDTILAKGEARTKEQQDQLKQQTEAEFKFSLDSSNLYQFEGVDYAEQNASRKKKKLPHFIDLGDRERKPSMNYNVNAYYSKAIYNRDEPRRKGVLLRRQRGPTVHDFQFPSKRLVELQELEAKRHDEALAMVEKNRDIDRSTLPRLTDREVSERDDLLEDTFVSWSRREYQAFLRGSERYGRTAYHEIAREIDGKDEAEVEAYAQRFWKDYKTLADWEKVVGNIEKGEARLVRWAEMAEHVARKVGRYDDPWTQLTIEGNVARSRFTEEEDRYLICMTNLVGYGNWDALREEVVASWLFRFNWYLKSRTPDKLRSRVEVLTRLIEKENNDLDNAERQRLGKPPLKKTNPKKGTAAAAAAAAKAAKALAARSRQAKAVKRKVPAAQRKPPKKRRRKSAAEREAEAAARIAAEAEEEEAAMYGRRQTRSSRRSTSRRAIVSDDDDDDEDDYDDDEPESGADESDDESGSDDRDDDDDDDDDDDSGSGRSKASSSKRQRKGKSKKKEMVIQAVFGSSDSESDDDDDGDESDEDSDDDDSPVSRARRARNGSSTRSIPGYSSSEAGSDVEFNNRGTKRRSAAISASTRPPPERSSKRRRR